jgi:hypothetical protein
VAKPCRNLINVNGDLGTSRIFNDYQRFHFTLRERNTHSSVRLYESGSSDKHSHIIERLEIDLTLSERHEKCCIVLLLLS